MFVFAGVRFRDRQDRGSASPLKGERQGRLFQRGLSAEQRDEVPPELLREASALQNVLPLPRSPLQESKTQVENYHPGTPR